MKLNYLLVCENAFTDSVGRLSLIQIFDSIVTESFPVVHPKVVIVTNLSVEDKDLNKPFEHVVAIIEPETKKEIARIKFETDKVNLVNKNLQFISNVTPIRFEKEGDYIIRIFAGKEIIGEKVIRLVERPIEQGNA